MYFHKAQEKPQLYGSFQSRQYSIWRNLEEIYGVDHESEVLIMPLFWGLPCLDYSKFGNHGVNHGASFRDGSLNFDGGNDYGDTPYKHNSGVGSISLRLKPDSVTGQRLFAGHNDGNNHRFYLGIDGIKTFWAFGDTYEKVGYGTPQSHGMTAGNRYYLTLTGDGTTARYYVDKIEIDTLSYSWNAGTSANNFYIGAALSGFMTYANGNIDEIRVAKAVRTADQVALFYDRPWDLYRRVARPIWSLPAAEVTIPIFMSNYLRQMGA